MSQLHRTYIIIFSLCILPFVSSTVFADYSKPMVDACLATMAPFMAQVKQQEALFVCKCQLEKMYKDCKKDDTSWISCLENNTKSVETQEGMLIQGTIQDACIAQTSIGFQNAFYKQIMQATTDQITSSLNSQLTGNADNPTNLRYIDCISKEFNQRCKTRHSTVGIDQCVATFLSELDSYRTTCQ